VFARRHYPPQTQEPGLRFHLPHLRSRGASSKNRT